MIKKYSQIIYILTAVFVFTAGICFADGAWSKDLAAIIESIISKLFTIIGGLCLLVIIIGGIVWMTAGGDTKKVDLGKAIVKAAILGLIVVLAAGLIVTNVVNLGN
ncbi:MAG: hypothetical protein WCX74_00995 [Candidatus Paceibacterota bacterium]